MNKNKKQGDWYLDKMSGVRDNIIYTAGFRISIIQRGVLFCNQSIINFWVDWKS